jgi:Fe-S cluster assembly protein SufB
MAKSNQVIDSAISREYEYGFVTDIDQEIIPPGLNEGVIRLISSKKNEPDWLLDWRLKAYGQWLKMEEPNWAKLQYSKIDFQAISYYSAPKEKEKLKSLDEVDPELLDTYTKLGIPLEEQKMLANVAVDAVFDSVSVTTTFKEELSKVGVHFLFFF